MSRARQVPADQRIAFPHTQPPTRCRTQPRLFDYEHGDKTDAAKRRRLASASLRCAACPVATACLKWALANPDLTRSGIWAATTPGKRMVLRKRLADRLGDNWVTVITDTGTSGERLARPLAEART
jgi:Transcription factor WhiB